MGRPGHLNKCRGQELMLLFSWGERCLIWRDSRVARSKGFLQRCRILKSSRLKVWLCCSEWERMEEWEGLERGRPVLAERPLCSANLRVRFLLVSPMYCTLQCRQVYFSYFFYFFHVFTTFFLFSLSTKCFWSPEPPPCLPAVIVWLGTTPSRPLLPGCCEFFPFRFWFPRFPGPLSYSFN